MGLGAGPAGLLTAIPQLIGGIVAKSSHDKYAKLLDGSTLDMPSQYKEARGIYEKLAATGLPGVDQAKLDLMGTVPSSLRAYQSVADNPASIMGALSDAQSGVNQGLADLSIKDAVAKIQNMSNLGNYMQQEGAVQGQYDQYNNQIKMSAGAERMTGTSELLKGITGGISGGISAYGNMKMANDMEDYYNGSGMPLNNPQPPTTVATATQPALGIGASVAPSRDILKYLESIGLAGASGSGGTKSFMDLLMGGMGSQFSPVAK